LERQKLFASRLDFFLALPKNSWQDLFASCQKIKINSKIFQVSANILANHFTKHLPNGMPTASYIFKNKN
jgi:hypothetical protein